MKSWWSYWRHYVIAGVLSLAILLLLPAEGGLTAIGVRVLAVLAPVLYLWIFENTDWVSVLALAALIMTGAMTPSEVFAQSMGHPIIMTIIVCMALNACLMQAGVIDKIATWFITRKIVRGRPYAFLAMFLLSYLMLGLFMETLSLAIIYISIAQSLLSSLGYEKGDPFYTAMMACILWGNAVATAASPISHAMPLILIAQMENTLGVSVSFATWLSVGIPYAALMFAVAVFVLRFVWKPDASRFTDYDIDGILEQQKPLGARGRAAAAIFAILVFFWVFPEIASPFLPAFASYMSAVGSALPPMIAVALVCLLRVEGKPIAQFSEISREVPMGVLIFTAAVTVLGNAISLESTGITAWVGGLLEPVVAGLPTIAVIAILLLGALVLTNFISNTVTMLVFYSVAIALLAGSGINIVALSIVIGLVSCFGVLVPSSAVPAPLFFGPRHITVGNTARYNIVFIALALVVSVALLWPLAQLIVPII